MTRSPDNLTWGEALTLALRTAVWPAYASGPPPMPDGQGPRLGGATIPGLPNAADPH